MPGLFIPYEKNGRHYVDGRLVNGLPINRVKRHKGDFVIAVDLDTYGNGREKSMEQEYTLRRTHLSKHLEEQGSRGGEKTLPMNRLPAAREACFDLHRP